MLPTTRKRLTYADSGVDIAAGEKAVELIKAHVRSTFRPRSSRRGRFRRPFAVDWKRYRDPLLVSSTDGVGTKSVIARLAGRPGDDRPSTALRCRSDDIAALGAEPLFFLDYISVGALVPEEIDELRRRCRRRMPRGSVRAARRRDVGASRRDGAGEFDLVASPSASSNALGAPARRARRRPRHR